MHILIAPDKFKGSLSAREVAANIALGLCDVLRDAKIDIVPMADGGEGTAEVICDALGGSWLKCKARDPVGREIDARYASIEERKLAVMEMSEAAGMRRLTESERDPLRATTFGVGEMILDAATRGANEIIIGLGGSATNDGGFGMARALGFKFFGGEGELINGPMQLTQLTRIVNPIVETLVPSAYPVRRRLVQTPLQHTKIIAAVDVKNPLLGPNGATHTFGPQKGASPEQLALLERSLAHWADTVTRDLGCDFRNEPGAGAAGGLGFGLMSFCNAKVQPGFEVVADAVALEQKIKRADVIITGEGKLDNQTLEGKTPSGVAELARKFSKRIFAIVGRAEANSRARDLFDGVYELAGTIPEAKELLRERARELATMLKG